jgi:hypothetical protein
MEILFSTPGQDLETTLGALEAFSIVIRSKYDASYSLSVLVDLHEACPHAFKCGFTVENLATSAYVVSVKAVNEAGSSDVSQSEMILTNTYIYSVFPSGAVAVAGSGGATVVLILLEAGGPDVTSVLPINATLNNMNLVIADTAYTELQQRLSLTIKIPELDPALVGTLELSVASRFFSLSIPWDFLPAPSAFILQDSLLIDGMPSMSIFSGKTHVVIRCVCALSITCDHHVAF